MQRLKNKILIFSLIFDVIVIGALYFYFFEIPHDKIKNLEKGYIEIKMVDSQVRYRQVQKRPWDWVPLEYISLMAQRAIVLSEDWSFYQHEGFDWAQIQRAIQDSIIKVKRPRGASTISQQLVKNIYLSHEYSFIRKAREVFIAHVLEQKTSKDKILEIYLNIVEFGPEVYGIRSAAWHYFRKHPVRLSAREGAFLAMMLPSPQRYYISFEQRELSNFAKKLIDSILEKMHLAKVFSRQEMLKQKRLKFFWEN